METILSMPSTYQYTTYIALIIPCSEPNALLEGKCDHGQVRDQISSDYREMKLSTRKFGMTMILSQCISVFFNTVLLYAMIFHFQRYFDNKRNLMSKIF